LQAHDVTATASCDVPLGQLTPNQRLLKSIYASILTGWRDRLDAADYSSM
jgi:hypothetical protein